ncbi:MAG TPA: heme ABC transporter permease [Alphaproteobacteria bacterium]|nr:heme ABC transporter permease [Alphaproteobacteria bacterium]
MHFLVNPARFMRIGQAVLPWCWAVAGICLALGLWFALVTSPADYQQGESVRIMYIHVPSAWMALGAYTLIAVVSAMALVWKHPLAFLIGRAAAPLGAGFTVICLVTGSLWGQTSWGTWWVWDARLTSVLVLFFLYLGYMALGAAFDDQDRGNRAAAILALVGVVNVPIIKFSVDWWATLHQPASVLRVGGPAIHPSMLTPLLLMAVGFLAYFLALLILRVRAEIAGRKVQALMLAGGAALGERAHEA